MKYTCLELVGFKRMSLNNVGTFTIRPTEPIQLILGTNGSGKSSLIGELSPLPADPANYTKDGSKTISIAHRGRTYVLKSWFQPSTKHSFRVEDDGEEAEKNPGGTATVQKELIRQHFGFTSEIHELLVGLQNFTSMRPTDRREWFTLLSDVNYDYALEVFGKLKERTRDISGALKLAKKRLVSESEKIVSEDEEQKLKRDVHELVNELELLQSQRAPVTRPAQAYRQDLTAGLQELERLSQRLLRIKFVAPYGHLPTASRDDWGELVRPTFLSLTEIDQYIATIKQDISVKEALINKAVADHGKIKETVDVLVKRGEEGIKALLEKQNDLRARKKTILAGRQLALEGSDPHHCFSAVDSIHELLVTIFSTLPENEEKRFSQTRLVELQQTLLATKDRHTVKVNQIAKLNSQKQHAESHKNNNNVTCPNCNHHWIVGYSEAKFAELLEELDTRETERKALETEIQGIEDEIGKVNDYLLLYRDFVRCVRSWPVLQPFWDYLMEGGYVSKSPRMVLSLMDSYRQDLLLDMDAKKLEIELQDLQKLILAAEEVGDANLTEVKGRLDEVTLVIEELTGGLMQLQKDLMDYNHYRKQLAEAEELGRKIAALQSQVHQTNDDMIEMMRRETLNHCISQVTHSLGLKEDRLNKVNLQKGIIQNLEKQIQDLTIQEEAAKQLAKHLSPTDGLIAEGLLGFIRSFTGQMNSILKKIWSYPLVIKDCGVSSETGAELDYKFPLLVQTRSNEVPDVSKGSSGMQEIVNLAFKLVAMKYLGLAEAPVVLDEFAKTMDVAHKASAGELIKNLITQYSFSQLYIVSHDYGQYGSLTNAEICVLCPNNITVPSTYNQHVTIH